MLTISIIVHGNDAYIADCIRSIVQTTTMPYRIVLTLNTGWTAALEALRTRFPDVEFVVNQTPRGFAANHNAVLKQTTTEFAAVLNDDIIVHEGALDRLVGYLREHSGVGIVGPRLLNSDGTVQVSTYSDPRLARSLYRVSWLAGLTSQRSLLRRLFMRAGGGARLNLESMNFSDVTRDVPIIKGAAMLVRRAAWEQVGLMDETTAMYGEEADWHWRMRQAGWRVVIYPQVRVTHYGQGQATLKLRGRLLVEDRKAILRYYFKHRPTWQAETLRWFVVLTHILYGLLWIPFNRDRALDYWRVVHVTMVFRS